LLKQYRFVQERPIADPVFHKKALTFLLFEHKAIQRGHNKKGYFTFDPEDEPSCPQGVPFNLLQKLGEIFGIGMNHQLLQCG